MRLWLHGVLVKAKRKKRLSSVIRVFASCCKDGGALDAVVELVVSKAIPTVQKFMTSAPHTIGAEQSLAKAHEMMREHRIRHLPVLSGGKLVGMVTDRDLRLVESLRDVDPKKVSVEDAMTSEVFSVPPDQPLDEVVDAMGQKRIGSAVVMHNQNVVGIFTTVDVCTAFAELLHTRLAK